MKHVFSIAMMLVFAAAFAVAQTGMQSPPTTPPTFPSQQQPGTQPLPDENTGQAGAASTTAITKAQADIQTAIRRQLPASADSVTVSTTDDNKIRLTGTVTSETEKNQIEQIARSAAPDMKIDNKLTVANSPSGPNAMPPGPGGVQNPEGKEGNGTTPTTTKPLPPMGSSFMPQQSGSSGSASTPSQSGSNPNNGAQGSTNSGTSSTGAQSSPSSATSGTNSGDVQGNIQKALQQDPNLASQNISVNVTGNKIELTGTVASKDQKKTAEQIANTNAGGMKVVDHLKVEHSKAGKDNANPSKY